MGGNQSAPETQSALLDRYSRDEQRMLLRNCSLLAQSGQGSFGASEWLAVQCAMGEAFAAGLFRGFTRDEVLSTDCVIRTLVGLREDKTARLLFLVDAAGDDDLCGFIALIGSDGAAWLRTLAPGRWAAASDQWLAQLGAPPSPPPPSARGRAELASWAAGSRVAVAAAEALAQMAEAAWLVDHRELQPLPDLGGSSSDLLPAHALRPLTAALPPAHRKAWRLVFSSYRDGASFTRLCKLAFARAPCLLVIRDEEGTTFGGYSPEPLHLSPKFYGSFSSFLFRVGAGDATTRVLKASGDNSNFVYCNAHREMLPNGIAFGGNLDSRFFGLWLHESLETGRAEEQCSTYLLDGCIASAPDFAVAGIEFWAVADDPPAPEEDAAGGGALSEAHKETRAFLAMAGRDMRSENVAPPLTREEEEEQDDA